jgi:hypothetical protein
MSHETQPFNPLAQARVDAQEPAKPVFAADPVEVESKLQEARYHEWLDEAVLGENGQYAADMRLLPNGQTSEDLGQHPYASEVGEERLAEATKHGKGIDPKHAQNFVEYMESRPEITGKTDKQRKKSAENIVNDFEAARKAYEEEAFEASSTAEANRIAGLGVGALAKEIREAREANDRTKVEDLTDLMIDKADALTKEKAYTPEQIDTLMDRLSRLSGEKAEEEAIAAEIKAAEEQDTEEEKRMLADAEKARREKSEAPEAPAPSEVSPRYPIPAQLPRRAEKAPDRAQAAPAPAPVSEPAPSFGPNILPPVGEPEELTPPLFVAGSDIDLPEPLPVAAEIDEPPIWGTDLPEWGAEEPGAEYIPGGTFDDRPMPGEAAPLVQPEDILAEGASPDEAQRPVLPEDDPAISPALRDRLRAAKQGQPGTESEAPGLEGVEPAAPAAVPADPEQLVVITPEQAFINGKLLDISQHLKKMYETDPDELQRYVQATEGGLGEWLVGVGQEFGDRFPDANDPELFEMLQTQLDSVLRQIATGAAEQAPETQAQEADSRGRSRRGRGVARAVLRGVRSLSPLGLSRLTPPRS